MSEAMSALREAIIALAAEDMSMIDQMTDHTEEVVEAWNAVCEASPTVGVPTPITPEDIEGQFI